MIYWDVQTCVKRQTYVHGLHMIPLEKSVTCGQNAKNIITTNDMLLVKKNAYILKEIVKFVSDVFNFMFKKTDYYIIITFMSKYSIFDILTSCLIGKLLITSGYPYENGTNTEIIDMLNPQVKCLDRIKNGRYVTKATGGVVG